MVLTLHLTCRELCLKHLVMLNGLPVLNGCDVTLSVAGKGKFTTRTAGNTYTMPHQLDVGPAVDCTMSKMPTTAIAVNVRPEPFFP